MEKTHISSQFDADLEDIRTRLLQMGGLVEEQVRAATEYYGEHKAGVAERIREVEAQVNQLELDLDDRCTHLIVRRQPAAGDLRLVMAVVKTITDLERIGDEADKIARYAKAMHDRGLMQLPGFSDVHVAAHIAAGMLKDALDAFARLDAVQAGEIVKQDKQIDNEFRSILRQLITFMMEDPRTISRSLEILFIAKALERVGDHSKNMAEYVIYMVKGRDVRHTSIEDVEKELLE